MPVFFAWRRVDHISCRNVYFFLIIADAPFSVYEGDGFVFVSSLHPPSKACTIISMNADALRVILVTFLVAIYLLAVSYLRRRKLSNLAYAFWGTFALLLPAFGPFFVIAYRPGELVSRKRSRHGTRAERDRSVRK